MNVLSVQRLRTGPHVSMYKRTVLQHNKDVSVLNRCPQREILLYQNMTKHLQCCWIILYKYFSQNVESVGSRIAWEVGTDDVVQ